MSSSALHQPNSSPYTTHKSHHTCFSELPGLANPAYPISLWDPILDTSQQGEDLVVPDTSDAFSFSDSSGLQLYAGLQLPVLLPAECNYLSGCGFDEPGLTSSVHFTNVPENGPTSDVMMVQDYGTSNFASSAYDQLGKTSWEIQSRRNEEASTPITRVGRYSVEERRDRILRYLKKRNQRNFNKTIKYACRKTLADRRIRVRGRFAKNNEEGVDMKCTRNDDTSSSYHDYADQRKQDGEAEWLQEAISSLMYNMAPYNYNHGPQCQATGLPLQ